MYDVMDVKRKAPSVILDDVSVIKIHLDALLKVPVERQIAVEISLTFEQFRSSPLVTSPLV